MLILLSPAKKLDFSERGHAPTATRPALIERTKELSKTTAKLSASKIKSLMHLSDDLAELNRERFKAFDPDSTEGRPAAMAFNGEVYSGLDAPTLSSEDLQWAQQRLRILSGLYGVLRPLDTIQPYRLEMGTKLKTPKGGNLYDFWGADIASQLVSRMPRSVRFMLETLGSPDPKSADLTSYLLFDPEYTRALIDIGYRDAHARRDEIETFLRT